MKIVINNTRFDYNIGCKLIKAKHGNNCPTWFNQPEIWNEIEPITFKEISSTFSNIEERRIAISCLGIENLVSEVNPTLLSSETITKTTTFVNQKGEVETLKFDDTYGLFEVDAESLGLSDGSRRFGWSTNERKFHFIQCKDTSTDRVYLIWIDSTSVFVTNNSMTGERHLGVSSSINYGELITPIQAIAWTIQTNIKEGGIEKMIRQGDCILIKKKKEHEVSATTRHITEKEYRELLVLES